MQHIRPSIALKAAQAIADIVSEYWRYDGLPPVEARLSMMINEATGDEKIPSAYAIPVGNPMERTARGILSHEPEIAVVVLLHASKPGDAEKGIEMCEGAVAHLLDIGSALNGTVKFSTAEITDYFDQALLMNQGIFRCQFNIQCKAMESL